MNGKTWTFLNLLRPAAARALVFRRADFKRSLAFGLPFVLGLFLAGVAPVGAQPRDPRVGDLVPSFEMTWVSKTPEQIAARAQAIAQALFGAAAGAVEVHPEDAPGGAVRRFVVSIPGAPTWQVRYLPSYDEFRALDLASAYGSPSGAPVTEATAREVAHAAFNRLAESGAVDARQYDWGAVEVASAWRLAGTVESTAFESTRVDYRFTLRRSIGGIEVANAGLRLAVDVAGHLSEFRFGGVTIASQIGADGVERPVGAGGWQVRRIESDEARERFLHQDVPTWADADIAWARVMYAMPDEAGPGQSVVIEPRYVVSYALKSRGGDGEPVSSRRLIRSYSISDPTAPTLDLAPPARDPLPDPEPKSSGQ